MRSGTGFFLSVGVGLGIGLFSAADWLWQGLIGIAIISILHIITESDYYKDSVSNCQKMNVEFKMSTFFVYTLLLSAIPAFGVFGIIRAIMCFL